MLLLSRLFYGIEEESEDDASRPLYMCIKVGKKFNLVPGHGGTFVRTRLKPEYWFDIPRDRYRYPFCFRCTRVSDACD